MHTDPGSRLARLQAGPLDRRCLEHRAAGRACRRIDLQAVRRAHVRMEVDPLLCSSTTQVHGASARGAPVVLEEGGPGPERKGKPRGPRLEHASRFVEANRGGAGSSSGAPSGLLQGTSLCPEAGDKK